MRIDWPMAVFWVGVVVMDVAVAAAFVWVCATVWERLS